MRSSPTLTRAARTATIVLLSISCVLARAADGALLLERVLAVVDGRALYLSVVRAVEAVDRVSRDVALPRLVDETLLFQEAFRLPQATVIDRTPDGSDAVDGATRRLAHRRAVI